MHTIGDVPFVGRVDVQSLPDLTPVSLVAQEVNGQTELTAAVRNVGAWRLSCCVHPQETITRETLMTMDLPLFIVPPPAHSTE